MSRSISFVFNLVASNLSSYGREIPFAMSYCYFCSTALSRNSQLPTYQVSTQSEDAREEGRTKCLAGLQCIDRKKMCDGHPNDCLDGSDENETLCRGLTFLVCNK